MRQSELQILRKLGRKRDSTHHTFFEPPQRKKTGTQFFAHPIKIQRNINKKQDDVIQASYIWIGGNKTDIRTKTKTLERVPFCIHEIPEWNYDGSSTNQAPGENSEVWLVPVKYVTDPFRLSSSYIRLQKKGESD